MMYVAPISFTNAQTRANLGHSFARYISVYPIALSVRSSNVYEERSLGLADDLSEDGGE
jgi:hypothetical protein